ncbi:putative bacteriocin export ABC transporter [Pilibacter termitis]|uniref:putative bacteriocin export ABC transporter n=1 Tax=Pilibacter termitis TaxID=263852 RepID=UPI00099A41FA
MVKISKLNKSFKGKEVLKNITLHIPEKKFVVIYGESGSGKSTLLNMIGLIDSFDSGELTLFNRKAPPRYATEALLLRRNFMSYMFQNYALIEDETIQENLDIALCYEKLSKKEKREKQNNALSEVNLKHSLKTKIYHLSGGEKQRVALARVILKPSRLILADEPTGSLDEKNRDEIIQLLKKEVEKGKTVVVVSHDPYVIEQAELSFSMDKLNNR